MSAFASVSSVTLLHGDRLERLCLLLVSESYALTEAWVKVSCRKARQRFHPCFLDF